MKSLNNFTIKFLIFANSSQDQSGKIPPTITCASLLSIKKLLVASYGILILQNQLFRTENPTLYQKHMLLKKYHFCGEYLVCLSKRVYFPRQREKKVVVEIYRLISQVSNVSKVIENCINEKLISIDFLKYGLQLTIALA